MLPKAHFESTNQIPNMKDDTNTTAGSDSPSTPRSPAWCEVDDVIEILEQHGLGWSLDHTGNLIEARIWDWPDVVGRYRPRTVEPLVHMLQTAMMEVPKHYWESIKDHGHERSSTTNQKRK